jgi:hypothetical protein
MKNPSSTALLVPLALTIACFGCVGPGGKGDAGPAGPAGPAGAAGPQGLQGPPIATTTTDVVAGIAYTVRSASGAAGLATASCLAGETATGGGCYCDGSASDQKAGVVFGCMPVGGVSWSGSCYPAVSGQANLPTIVVNVICAASTATTVYRSPLVATSPEHDSLVEQTQEQFRQQQEAYGQAQQP